MSTGTKRPREGPSEDLHYGSDSDRSTTRRDVRRRGDESKDWRDAHLNGDRHRRDSANGRGYHDRRDDRYTGREHRVDRDQNLSPKYGRSGYGRHRDDDRAEGRYSDRGSYRGKPYDRARPSSYRKEPYDDRRRQPTPSLRESRPESRNISPGLSAGKEEGEISPRLSNLAIASPAHPPPSAPMTPKGDSSKDGIPQNDSFDEAPEDEDLTAEQIIAARRARRQAILAKYNQTQDDTTPATTVQQVSVTPPRTVSSLSSNPVAHNDSATADPAPPNGHQETITKEEDAGIRTPEEREPEEGFSLTKENGDEKDSQRPDEAEQISAADYDPDEDRREELRRAQVQESTAERTEIEEEVEVEEDDDEDVDDMFAAVIDKPKKKKRKLQASKAVAPVQAATNVDSAADAEGYYQIILGESLDNGQYQVFSTLGKGMFSAVVRARVVAGDDAGKEVAIKMIRSQETMYKAGLKEASILNKLAAADPEDKKHIIRLEKTFEHRGHLCLVFESLSMNLREVVKRFGKDVGLNIRAVRAYAQQMFLALSLLKKCNIMHADIKPDNILVTENKAMLKLCDLGSASDVSENDITPYLVSRFYRAPEIILGLPYDTALDMWSVGCTLYELYTGKILFPGRTNNNMLLLMMELKGRINTKLIKKAKFGDVHFDENGAFLNVEIDKLTGNNVTRNVFIQRPTRDLRARLVPPSMAKSNDEEAKTLLSFVDLLDKCLNLDPSKRLTPRDALIHPFIRGL